MSHALLTGHDQVRSIRLQSHRQRMIIPTERPETTNERMSIQHVTRSKGPLVGYTSALVKVRMYSIHLPYPFITHQRAARCGSECLVAFSLLLQILSYR